MFKETDSGFQAIARLSLAAAKDVKITSSLAYEVELLEPADLKKEVKEEVEELEEEEVKVEVKEEVSMESSKSTFCLENDEEEFIIFSKKPQRKPQQQLPRLCVKRSSTSARQSEYESGRNRRSCSTSSSSCFPKD